MGWALLHCDQPKPAVNHFRTAVRLEPNNTSAWDGLERAEKESTRFYRDFYSRLELFRKSRAFRIVAISIWLTTRAIPRLAHAHPSTAFAVAIITGVCALLHISVGLADGLMWRLTPTRRERLGCGEAWAAKRDEVLVLAAYDLTLLVVPFAVLQNHWGHLTYYADFLFLLAILYGLCRADDPIKEKLTGLAGFLAIIAVSELLRS